MDDDPFEEQCEKEECINLKNNMKHMIAASKKQAHDLQAFSSLQASYEIIRHQLVATEAVATSSTEKYNASVNAKEIAEEELKQLQATATINRRKMLMLQEKADKSEQHEVQANHWRLQYDDMAQLAGTLNEKNNEVKNKYQQSVDMLASVAKQLNTADNQLKALKTANADLASRQKNLDKYLKSAIKVIDTLSTTSNMSKQPKPIKDLVNLFRRDDVRLFFNATPWKNSSASEPVTEVPDPDREDSQLGALSESSTSSADEDPLGEPLDIDGALYEPDIDLESDEEIAQMERSLRKSTRKAARRSSPVKYLAGKKKFTRNARDVKIRSLAKQVVEPVSKLKHPKGLRTLGPNEGLISYPPEFVGGPEAAAGTSSGAGATIHGRKVKTVREQQAEMMKESMKDKVARLKQQQQEQHTKPVASAPAPRHCMSEGSEDEGEAAPPSAPIQDPVQDPIPPPESPVRRGRGRPRTKSWQQSEEKSTEPPPLPQKSASDSAQIESRNTRAKTRSMNRVELEKELSEHQPVEKSIQESINERLQKARLARKKPAAPAPLDAGPPTRSKSQQSVQSPKKKERVEEDRLPAGLESVESAESGEPKSSEITEKEASSTAGNDPEKSEINAEPSESPALGFSEIRNVNYETEMAAGYSPVYEYPEMENQTSESSQNMDTTFEMDSSSGEPPLYARKSTAHSDLFESSATTSDAPEPVELIPPAVILPPEPVKTAEPSETPPVIPPEVILPPEPIRPSELCETLPVIQPKVISEPSEPAESTVESVDQPEETVPTEPVELAEPIEQPEPSQLSETPVEPVIQPEVIEPVKSVEPEKSEPTFAKPKPTLKPPNHTMICDLGLDISDSSEDEEERAPAQSVSEAKSVEIVAEPTKAPSSQTGTSEKSIQEEESEEPVSKSEAPPTIRDTYSSSVPTTSRELPDPPRNAPEAPKKGRPRKTPEREAPPTSDTERDKLKSIERETVIEKTMLKKLSETRKIANNEPREKSIPKSSAPEKTDSEVKKRSTVRARSKSVTRKAFEPSQAPVATSDAPNKDPENSTIENGQPEVSEAPTSSNPSLPENPEESVTTSEDPTAPSKFEKRPEKPELAPERTFKRRGETSVKVAPPPKIQKKIAPSMSPSDDFLGDILSGAKMTVKKEKPVKPMKRAAPSDAPTAPKIIKSSDEPKKSSVAKKPPVPIIEPPAPRARVVKKEKSPDEEPRRRGRPSLAPGAPRGKANTLKAQLRQALDLKVAVHELKRPMEEKGIILGDSIPLEASDAADVMIDFLRETSASDMWAVLKRQRVDGNCAPLMNTEEQNFLQVSVSLNEHDQLLLELFVGRILAELAVRDSLDSRQLGRLSRLFCHSVHFADKPADEKSTWMRRFVLLLLLKHPGHLVKSVAFCLISDAAEHCTWLIEQLNEHPDAPFATSFRCLLHVDPEEEGVVNWLLNSTFQMGRLAPPTSEEIKKAFRTVFREFCDGNSNAEVLKSSVFLAKTGKNECLEVAFEILKGEMSKLQRQFIHDKDKEPQHRTVFSLSAMPSQMTLGEAVELRKKFEWLKCVLLVIIDNRHTDKWKAVIDALRSISPEIVTIRELIASSSSEQFVEHDAVNEARGAIDQLAELISEFTNFPLKTMSLPNATSSTTSDKS